MDEPGRAGAEIKRYSYVLPVPRELLLDAGMVEATPAERAKAEREIAELRRQAAANAATLDAARQRLAEITDPLARSILDLHHEDKRGECEGDDSDGWEAESPEWPCRTVEAVAAHYGIEMPWQI